MLALILLNGVLSGAEIAILSVRRTRLQELEEAERSGASAVAGLRANPERFLATVQVGITVVGATAAAFSGSSIAARLVPGLSRVPFLAPFADDLAFVLVVAGVSYLSLVLGELVPKSLALRAAEPYALLIGPPLAGLAWLARPLVWALTASSNVVLRVFGDHTSFTEARLSPDELSQLVDEAASAGTLDARVGEIATRALAFEELDASTIMVPRHRLVSLPRDASIADLADLARTQGRARVLIHGGDIDDVVGYVAVRDVLAAAHADPGLRLEDVIRPVPFVPETLTAPALLKLLQREGVAIAVVIDEQGGVRGLVTMEDLVEELVGEILSEDEVAPTLVTREDDGAALVQGATPIHDVNRALGIELPETETFTTLAGLCLEEAGRIPAPGEVLQVDGFTLEIVDASARRVKLVRIRTSPSEG